MHKKLLLSAAVRYLFNKKLKKKLSFSWNFVNLNICSPASSIAWWSYSIMFSPALPVVCTFLTRIFSFLQVCARTAWLLPVRADGNKAAHAENCLRLDVGSVSGAVLPAWGLLPGCQLHGPIPGHLQVCALITRSNVKRKRCEISRDFLEMLQTCM